MLNEEYTPDLEQDENETQEVESTEDTSEETTNQSETSFEDEKDWKAEALKYKAILDRNKNKPTKEPSKKSNDLDYGQKAFLVANGIKGNDEIKLVQDFIRNTGKALDDVIDSKFFQAELNEMRELKKSANANLKSSNRNSNSANDQVEYWLAKPFGELPDDFELRKKVVKARRDASRKKGMFTPE